MLHWRDSRGLLVQDEDETLNETGEATIEAPAFSEVARSVITVAELLPAAQPNETMTSNASLVTRVAPVALEPDAALAAHDLPTRLRKAPAVSNLKGDRYEPTRSIARGQTASVSEAYDHGIHRRVALKCLHNELINTDAAERFRREALITAWLDHPNILPIYDMVFRDGGPPELVMKLIHGQTLSDHCRGSLSDLMALDGQLTILQKVCDAVQFAHDAGVIHRDLKPDNIMVGRRGEVFVMDWGIAKLRSEVDHPMSVPLREAGATFETRTAGGIFGTPAFMAPEQALGQLSDVDERTDVFGLGAVLYFILTGKAPYPGHRLGQTMERARRGEVTRPKLATPDRPIRPELERLCMKALAKERSERYPTVTAFADDLHKAQKSGGWFEIRTYQKDEFIVRQGEPSTEAFLIGQGRCEVRQVSGDGHERVLRVLGPGDAFGELGVFTGAPRSASIVALSFVETQCIDRRSLEWAMEERGPFSILTRALANRFLEREREFETESGRFESS